MLLLADLHRCLSALRPLAADELLRELELRVSAHRVRAEQRGEASRRPVLTRVQLFEEIAPVVREAWPGRGEDLLRELQAALWPQGLIGAVSVPPGYHCERSEPGAAGKRPASSTGPLDGEPEIIPSFLVEKGTLRGLRILLHLDSMVFGSSPDRSDIVIADPLLAPAQMRLTLDARDQVFLEDVIASDVPLNTGVWINGKRSHETWLSHDDLVGCAGLEMRFLAGGPLPRGTGLASLAAETGAGTCQDRATRSLSSR